VAAAQVRRVGPAYLTPDTYVNARTDSCARLAAGACIDVAVAVARCAPRAMLCA